MAASGDRAEQPAAPVAGVTEVEPNVYSIRSEPEPHAPGSRLWHGFRRFALGEPLPSRLERVERIGVLAAIGLIGSDMIASSVYGPEEMMRTLGEAGPDAVRLAIPIGLSVIVLLAILAVSYQQTIGAYPSGAGGYIVATDNFGPTIGLLAAAALLVDYTLDVSVSIATGVQSLTSAVPDLAGARLWINLAVLAVLMLANLRGIRTAGALFSAPVHLYIVGTLAVVVFGVYRWSSGTLPPYTPPQSAVQALTQPTEAVGWFLVLRAFSGAAVALTGIEAVSNGVPYFKPSETSNARKALILMAVAFGAIFMGIAFLSAQLQVVADPDEVETILSQVTRTLLGTGWLFVVLQGLALVMLMLAADTGFTDFPRMLALLGNDGYVPSAFSSRGLRLSFSNGILLIAAVSAMLLIIFQGSVAGLVPLFTVGAFLTFTLSQAGMVRHWWRKRGGGWHWRLAVNAVGAATTTLVLVVVLISKFLHGAWIVVLLVPLILLALRAVGRHNQRLRANLRIDPREARPLVQELSQQQHHLLVPVSDADRLALYAVTYVESLLGDSGNGTATDRPRVAALHVTDDRTSATQLRSQWDALCLGVPLVILESPYRETAEALIRYIDLLQSKGGERTIVTVVLPETLPTRWWHPLLRNYLTWRLKWALFFRPRTNVLSVPYEGAD